jgi:serine/threonine protein kinase
VEVVGLFEVDGQVFLVMDLVGGSDLSELIQQRKSLPEMEAIAILTDILNGLGYAHQKGYIHRDIKPSNILIDEKGRARITDFGIAILADSKRVTTFLAGFGTPGYMSPEQIRDPKSIDPRSDIYSVGVLLYEMLTGTTPFEGPSDFSIQEQHLKEPVKQPADGDRRVSNRMFGIICKAMEKEPDRRFLDCDEFLNSVEDASQWPQVTDRRVGAGSEKQAGDNTRWFISVGKATAAIVIVGLVAYVGIRSFEGADGTGVSVVDGQTTDSSETSGGTATWPLCWQLEAKQTNLKKVKNFVQKSEAPSTDYQAIIRRYEGEIREIQKMIEEGEEADC